MSSDGRVPVKVLNASNKPVTLQRNTKLANVFPCIALEDLDISPQHPASHELKAFNQTILDMDVNSVTADLRFLD